MTTATLTARFHGTPSLPNVHFHALVLDRVFVREHADARHPLRYLELDTRTHEDIPELGHAPTRAWKRCYVSHGRTLDPTLADETPPELSVDARALAACYGATAHRTRHRAERAAGTRHESGQASAGRSVVADDVSSRSGRTSEHTGHRQPTKRRRGEHFRWTRSE